MIEQAKKYAEGLVRERDLVRKDIVKCTSKYDGFLHQNVIMINYQFRSLIFLRNCKRSEESSSNCRSTIKDIRE